MVVQLSPSPFKFLQSTKEEQMQTMKLYKISQTTNTGWETYDSAIVMAPSADAARRIHPDGSPKLEDPDDGWPTWAQLENIKVKLIGYTKISIFDKKGKLKPAKVILASFNGS
jgi:hypothetical protein